MVEHDIIVGDAEFESRTDPISFIFAKFAMCIMGETVA